jgi:tetratricopeptide (TPR) repeat protein
MVGYGRDYPTVTAPKRAVRVPDDDVPCFCGSGRSLRQCCGRAVGPASKNAPGPSHAAEPADRLASLDMGSFLPGDVRRRLDESAAIRRELDMQASLRLAPAAPKSTAERRRASAKLSKMAVALREAGQLAQSVGLLQQAIAATPDDANLHFDLGLTLVRCVRHADAVAPLRRATELRPDFAKAHHTLAIAYEVMGRNADAIAALRRAIECAPNFTDAHMMLGVLLHRFERLEEAQESFRRAAAAGRNTTSGRICESFVLSEGGRFAEAAEVLRRAVRRDPTNSVACTTLGHVLANMGDLDAAIAQFERALTLPGIPVATWAALAQIKKITEADRPLVTAMETCLQRERLVQRDQMTLHFTLGKAYDDLRDYAQAIQHYDSANRIRRRLHPFNRDRLGCEVDATIAQYTERFFVDHCGDGLEDQTPLLVLGMPRSGTTLVEQVLSSHPQIAAAGELTFWRVNGTARIKTPSQVAEAGAARRLADQYLALLRSFSPTAARIIDKALFNFYWIGLVLQALPRARIVHCRRHPIDTCLSIYFTQFETISDFVADRDDLVFYYRGYLRLMEHWRTVLSPERFIDVDYEAMVAEPEQATRRLIEFCGLAWDPACLRPEENRRAVTTASIWQVRQPIYRSSLERWRCYEPWLGSLRELMPPQP